MKTLRGAPALSLAAVAACVLVAAGVSVPMRVPANGDNSILLYVAHRVLRGDVLGREIVDVAPPLIVWLQLPVVLLAEMLGVSATRVLLVAVALVCLLVLSLSAWVLRRSVAASSDGAVAAGTLWLALMLGVLPRFDFGQREHVAVLLTVPWFLLLGVRMEGGTVGACASLLVGVLGGVGFAIKPFFLLPMIAGEVGLKWSGNRMWRKRPELVALASCWMAYAIALVLLARPWLASAMQLWPLYAMHARRSPWTTIRLGSFREAVALLACLGVVGLRGARGRASLAAALTLGSLGFLAAALIQAKGWQYHFLPTLVLGGSALAFLALETRGRIGRRRDGLLRAALVVAVGVLGVVVLRLLLLSVRHPPTPYWLPKEYDRLVASVARRARGRPIMVISASHGSAFPLVPDARAESSFRLGSLWPLLVVHEMDAQWSGAREKVSAPLDPPDVRETWLLDALAADLRTRPPALLIVVRDDSVQGGWSLGFDFDAYLRNSRQLAPLVHDYVPVERIGPFELRAPTVERAAGVTAAGGT